MKKNINSIKILGSDSPEFEELVYKIKNILLELDLNIEIELIKDTDKIISYNLLSIPALVINDQILFSGKVPEKEELMKEIIRVL